MAEVVNEQGRRIARVRTFMYSLMPLQSGKPGMRSWQKSTNAWFAAPTTGLVGHRVSSKSNVITSTPPPPTPPPPRPRPPPLPDDVAEVVVYPLRRRGCVLPPRVKHARERARDARRPIAAAAAPLRQHPTDDTAAILFFSFGKNNNKELSSSTPKATATEERERGDSEYPRGFSVCPVECAEIWVATGQALDRGACSLFFGRRDCDCRRLEKRGCPAAAASGAHVAIRS
jgi:hypothetical protein